jgi:hypothetical protein
MADGWVIVECARCGLVSHAPQGYWEEDPSCADPACGGRTVRSPGREEMVRRNLALTEDAPPGCVRVTEDFLLAARSARGGWTSEQLRILGVDWPPVKGWKRLAIGRTLTAQEARDFLRGRG